MRTTLTLDDDLFEELRELAHARRVSMRVLVNEVIRRGLGDPGPTEPFHADTFCSPFGAGVDPQRLNQLVDELEVEDALANVARDAAHERSGHSPS